MIYTRREAALATPATTVPAVTFVPPEYELTVSAREAAGAGFGQRRRARDAPVSADRVIPALLFTTTEPGWTVVLRVT